jgi:hypothetical protein
VLFEPELEDPAWAGPRGPWFADLFYVDGFESVVVIGAARDVEKYVAGEDVELFRVDGDEIVFDLDRTWASRRIDDDQDLEFLSGLPSLPRKEFCYRDQIHTNVVPFP